MKKLLLSFLLFSSSLLMSQTTVIDSIISGGIYRNYRIYIPAAYNGSTAWPLVFDLHGYTSSALNEQLYSNFMPISDTAHFLIFFTKFSIKIVTCQEDFNTKSDKTRLTGQLCPNQGHHHKKVTRPLDQETPECPPKLCAN